MTFLRNPATRRFTATVAAAATALALMTVAAVPARAGEISEDFAKVLAAFAAIALVGSAVNDHDDHRRPQAYVIDPPRRDRYRDRRASALPPQCAVQIRGYRLNEVVYPERCLRRAGVERRLPQRCEVTIQGRGRDRTAYEENCLLNAGFRSKGRHRH